MAVGLQAFTEGFGSGYTGVQKSRTRRRINKALDLEIAEGTLKREGKLSRANLFRRRAEEEEFEDYAGDLKPTWGEKLGGFFKQQAKKVGGAIAGGVGAAAGAIAGQNAPPQALPVPTDPQIGAPGGAPTTTPPIAQQPQGAFSGPIQTQRPVFAAKGGAVRHMIKEYYAGGKVNTVQPTPLANGGRAIPTNRSLPDRVTGVSGNMGFADGGNYSSGLHRVPQPLANGGRAIPASNTRSSSRTVVPLAEGGLLSSDMPFGTEDEKALKRAQQLKEQRAKTSKQATSRANAPKAQQGPIDDVAKQQRGSTAAKPAAETTPKMRKSAITGRDVKVKEAKPRKTARLAELAKKGGKLGAGAALGTFLVAEKALETGAPGLGVLAHAGKQLLTGGEMADVTGEAGITPTSEYRERLGMGGGSENEALRVAGDFLARGLGTLQELGDKLTFGYGEVISDWAVRKVMGVEDDTAAQPAPEQPQTQQPETALPTGDPTGPPGPTAPATDPAAQDDPEIDMAGPEMQGVMPEDLPSHSVEDWEKERYSAAAYAVTQGQDPNDAMLAIDQQQQRGFLRYLNQAQRLLVAGDAQSAARSMYAAYSYFPNGTDVRFGITEGADGMPILMGMGKDEVTGEPINDGKTMALTPETIAVLAENAQDPKAWRVWTKDWRDMEQQIREYEEVTKPTAQSEADYRGAVGRARETEAEAELVYRQSGSGGGLKESDYRGTATAINEIIWSDPDIDPEDINSLSAVGARAKRRYPNQDNMEIGAFIVKAYKDGLGPDEILDELDRLLSRP